MKKIVKKMTVFILTMVVAGMLWSTGMPQTQAAENTSVFKISMDKTKIKAGDSFRVTLELKEGADLSSFMLTLPYDNSLLKCKKITNGDLEEKGLLESADVDGTIRAGFMGTKGLNESSEIFSVQFQVMDNANVADLKFTPQFSDFVFGYGENEKEIDNPSSNQVKTEGALTISIIEEGNEGKVEGGNSSSENDSMSQDKNSDATEQSMADNHQDTDKQNEIKENSKSSSAKNTEASEKVKTGDESHVVIYAAIGIVALMIILGMGVVAYRKKRQ